MAKYRIHETSYIDDKLVIVDGTPVEFDTHAGHKPGPHWEPVDDEAKKAAKKHGHKFTGSVVDPIEELTQLKTEAEESAKAGGEGVALV